MKQGVYLSRLVEDPVSKKQFVLALVIVIGLHLTFLAIWKFSLSAPDLKKKPQLVIELGMPPPSGPVGEDSSGPLVEQVPLAQVVKPTANKTPGNLGSPSQLAPLAEEGWRQMQIPSHSNVPNAPSPAQTLSLIQNESPVFTEQLPKTHATPESAPNPPPQPTLGGTKIPNESVQTAEADYKAAYLNNPRPPYPRLAHRMGIEGTVILLADVSEEGMPLQVRLFQSSGNDLLDQSALNTVTQWRFTPARKDGVITRSTVRIPIIFSLKVQAKK